MMIRKSCFSASLFTIMIFISCKSNNISDPEIARLMLQAESAFRSGYYNAAIAIADSAISLNPKLADIYFLKGRVLTKLSRFAEAEDAYFQVISLDDKSHTKHKTPKKQLFSYN